MDEHDGQEQATVARYIEEEANAAILRGTGYAALLGFGSAALLLGLHLLGLARSMAIPIAFATTGGLASLLTGAFARRRWLTGPRATLFLLPILSLPTAFLLLTHAVMPAGAATYITGPMSYLYFFLIVLTGFLLDARRARVAGVVSAVGYLGCYVLARRGLALVQAADPTLLQDLTAPPIYVFKGITMIGVGALTGALASYARHLLVRVLQEEREKQGLSRLFGQFVSPEVKERIIREKAGVVGERKHVVVLFADIRSFTPYSERNDPAALVEHLNEYFDRMVACITSQGGVIDKFLGDAVMAVFGGVLDLPSPAVSALEAAKQMRKSLRQLNAAWSSRGMETFEHGIGLHFGEVLQGTIGSAARKEFTVIGDAVNTASRLEGLTKEHPFPIFVSAAFVEALPPERRSECVSLGLMRLRGKQQEVEVFGVSD